MSWNLFIDDERFPKDDSRPWLIARSMAEAIELIKQHGCPQFISFDHDLGCHPDETPLPTGYDFAHWLVNSDLDKKLTIPEGFQFNVHSANPTGAANIQGLMDGYLKFKTKN